MDIYYVYQVIIMSMQIDLLNVLDSVLDFIIKGITFFIRWSSVLLELYCINDRFMFCSLLVLCDLFRGIYNYSILEVKIV